MKTGDTVLHKPTGERWIVAVCNSKEVIPCGWPLTLADPNDCELVKSCSVDEELTLLDDMRKITDASDPRRLHAEYRAATS